MEHCFDCKVFEYLMEHCFECLIKLLKLIIKCGENEGVKSPKFMQIMAGYQNLLHGSDFLCVLVMNYTLGTRGSLAARFREMSWTAEGRPTDRRPAMSGKAARHKRRVI